jgi:GTPase
VQVPGVGYIVSGILVNGTARANDKLWMGPDFNGQFVQVCWTPPVPARPRRNGSVTAL